jgi:septal ring factor EnvC (AmiA/AmiB activator)
VEANSRTLEVGQAYGLRAWAAWLQSEISKAQPQLARQIDEHQREIARLRGTIERSSSVLKSLQATVEQLDEVLRNVHDTDIVDAALRLRASAEQQQQSARAVSPAHDGPGVPHDNARART